MSHTASKTWVSDQTQERERYHKFINSKHLVAPGSPFVPDTFEKWVEHRLGMKMAGQKTMEEKIKTKERNNRRESRAKLIPVLNGKRWKNNLGAVAAFETVFVPWYEDTDERAQPPWPSYEEFKHEGDDRERSKYRRQLPLARKPGNETVNWKQRQMQEPYSFDATVDRRSPQALQEVQFTERMASVHIGESLLEAINR